MSHYRRLRATITRGGLSSRSEESLDIVRAVGFMAHLSGNPILQTAMGDSDAAVRVAAVVAWRDVLASAKCRADSNHASPTVTPA